MSVLFSNSYNQINESELDVLLESIKEEEQTNASTTTTRTTVPFEWTPMLSKDVANDQLMTQLQLANDHRRQALNQYCSVLDSTATTTTAATGQQLALFTTKDTRNNSELTYTGLVVNIIV